MKTSLTNAVLLAGMAKDLYAAGLRSLNIHLDTLDRQRFHTITRRDELPRMLAGINATEASWLNQTKHYYGSKKVSVSLTSSH